MLFYPLLKLNCDFKFSDSISGIEIKFSNFYEIMEFLKVCSALWIRANESKLDSANIMA